MHIDLKNASESIFVNKVNKRRAKNKLIQGKGEDMLWRRTPLTLFLTMNCSDRRPKVLCEAGPCQAVLYQAKRWLNKAVNGACTLLSITLDSAIGSLPQQTFSNYIHTSEILGYGHINLVKLVKTLSYKFTFQELRMHRYKRISFYDETSPCKMD